MPPRNGGPGHGRQYRFLDLYRKDPSPSPCVRLRAHIILLLSEGHAWAVICAVLFCSSAIGIANTPWPVAVSQEGMEACRLQSERGIALVLLNWTDEPVLR